MQETTSQSAYIPDQSYLDMRAKLVALIQRGPGIDPEGDVTLALGEIGDVWPEIVRTDAEIA